LLSNKYLVFFLRNLLKGTLFHTITKTKGIVETLKQLGFYAMTSGNHKSEDGDDLLDDFIENLTFPVISSNIYSKNFIRYKLFLQYILALAASDTAIISKPSNLKILSQLRNALLN